MITTQEKLDEVERLIEECWRLTKQRNPCLNAIAEDLRGRLEGAPSVAVVELERRLDHLKQHPGAGPDRIKAVITVAEQLVCRWPTVKQALELFGAEIEGVDK